MPTIIFEANEHSALRVKLRGLAASYAGAEIVLAGGPAYSDAPLSTWASVAGVAVGNGEVAGYDLPLPQLEPGRYEIEVYAATPGERRADIMPAPGETIVLKVGNRRHDDGDVTPPAQVTVQQGTSEVRAGDGGGNVRLYVADPSGTRLDGEATHTLASTAVQVVERKIDLPTDELGRMPSVPTDEQGEVPLRARLDAIVSAAKGAATPSEVEALLEALASEHAALKQEHATLQGEHADLIEKLGQVLDAVGQIPTEPPTQDGSAWEAGAWTDPVTIQAPPDTVLKSRWELPYPRGAIFQPHLEMSFSTEWADQSDDTTDGQVRFVADVSPRIEFSLDEHATSEETHWLFPLSPSGVTRALSNYFLQGEVRLLAPYHEVQDLRFRMRYKL